MSSTDELVVAFSTNDSPSEKHGRCHSVAASPLGVTQNDLPARRVVNEEGRGERSKLPWSEAGGEACYLR